MVPIWRGEEVDYYSVWIELCTSIMSGELDSFLPLSPGSSLFHWIVQFYPSGLQLI